MNFFTRLAKTLGQTVFNRGVAIFVGKGDRKAFFSRFDHNLRQFAAKIIRLLRRQNADSRQHFGVRR